MSSINLFEDVEISQLEGIQSSLYSFDIEPEDNAVYMGACTEGSCQGNCWGGCMGDCAVGCGGACSGVAR